MQAEAIEFLQKYYPHDIENLEKLQDYEQSWQLFL
jgi:hypothetical protein